MTNELIPKVKAEIERLKGICKAQIKANPGQTFPFVMEMTGYDKILSFLSSLEPEKPIQEGLEKEIESYWKENGPMSHAEYDRLAKCARHFYETGCRRAAEMYDEIEYERQRAQESVSKDLEDAAIDIADTLLAKPKDYALSAEADYWNGAHDGIIAGAKWQKEQNTREMVMSDGSYFQKCYELGKKDMKEQMMKEAVEISYKGGTARINGEEKPFEGGTVRIIIVKDD